jgi:hypothetical protein
MPATKEKQLMSTFIRNGYKAKLGLHSLATVQHRLSALTAYHRERGYMITLAPAAISSS